MKKHETKFMWGLLTIVLLTVGCGQGDSRSHSTISWENDFVSAQKKAVSENQILMMEFSATWCPSCKMMNDSTFTDSLVIVKSKAFLPVRIDVDERKDIADQFGANAHKYGGVGIPNILFLAPNGRRLAHIIGYQDPKALVTVMDSVLAVR
jgi:thiol:disulfide interchange protein DsbD